MPAVRAAKKTPSAAADDGEGGGGEEEGTTATRERQPLLGLADADAAEELPLDELPPLPPIVPSLLTRGADGRYSIRSRPIGSLD